jgi:hypothetical protein
MQQRDLRKGICGRSSLTGVQRQTGKAPLWVLIVLGILSGLLMYGYTTPQECRPGRVAGCLDCRNTPGRFIAGAMTKAASR